MASTARRIAGNVGLGGPWRILFSPARLGEAAALQVGVGDHRYERVAVQAMPGAAFEVVEAKFFLELLVGLLADPSGLDRGGERLEAGVGRQVGKIVFALARGATLADQPGLLARHVLHALVMDALWRTIGDPHAYGGEGSRQRPFGSLAPADASPLCGGENVFSRRGELIGDAALARPPASGDRKREPDMARIDFLLLGGSDPPLQPPRVEPLAERRGQAIACIRQHRRKPDASGADAIDLGERDLRLRARDATVFGPASPVQLPGRNRRKPIITGTSSRASVSDTSVWQLAVLPSAEAYCGATPTECEPFFGSAVSSMTRAAPAPPISLSAWIASSSSSSASSRRRSKRNDATGRSRRAPIATPSARRSCGRPAQSAQLRRADTSVGAPCAQAAPGTAQANPKGRHPKPPSVALRKKQSAILHATPVNISSICQSSARVSEHGVAGVICVGSDLRYTLHATRGEAAAAAVARSEEH